MAHALVVRPFVKVILGLNIHNHELLNRAAPMVIVANHNNHIDTLVLMSLFPLTCLPRIRAVAAADYFLANRALSWIALNIFNILPIKRVNLTRGDGSPIRSCSDSLARGDILIIYPEGTRGVPERMARFKSGIAHLAKENPSVPIFPVFLRGLGRVLPKNAAVPVPFVCDVTVTIRFIGTVAWIISCKRLRTNSLHCRAEKFFIGTGNSDARIGNLNRNKCGSISDLNFRWGQPRRVLSYTLISGQRENVG